MLQREVVQFKQLVQTGAEMHGIDQVGNPQPAPGGTVFVGRTDAAPGRADRAGAAPALARLIERDVAG